MKNNTIPARGYSLIELCLVISLGSIVLSICLHGILQLSMVYEKIHTKLKIQNAALVARHYLQTDIHSAGYSTDLPPSNSKIATICNIEQIDCDTFVVGSISQLIAQHIIPAQSPVLILYNVPQNNPDMLIRLSTIAYYVRCNQHKHHYCTLYRDDFERNAVAIVSGIKNFTVEEIQHKDMKLKIIVTFYNQQQMELICAPRNQNLLI